MLELGSVTIGYNFEYKERGLLQEVGSFCSEHVSINFVFSQEYEIGRL